MRTAATAPPQPAFYQRRKKRSPELLGQEERGGQLGRIRREHVILRALPGMTGLWQVGDRNATGFDARVRTDVHYVRNWSPWLDVWVLARTIGVVVRGTGS